VRGITEMNRTRLGLLGLCAAVLGVVVFSVAGAHSEVGAKWLYANSFGAPVAFLDASAGLEAQSDWVLHTEIAKTKILFECKKIAAVNAVLKTEGRVGEGAKLKYSECVTKINGSTSSGCQPNAGGKESGVIVSNPLHGLVILVELGGGVKDDAIKVLPDSGETFATLEFGSECVLGTKIPIIGIGLIQDSENLLLTGLVKHLLSFSPTSQLWVISKTIEHSATLLGGAWVFLTGEHAGLKLSADPA
jgi:hypothetical protein